MRTVPASRGLWALAGIVAGLAGLATSYLAGLVLTVRQSPVVAVAEWIISLTPGSVVRWGIRVFGDQDKTLLVAGILVVVLLTFGVAGILARRRRWAGIAVFGVLTLLGFVATVSRPGFMTFDVVPLAVGFGTWVLVLGWLASALPPRVVATTETGADSAEIDADSAEIDAGSTGTGAGSSRRTFLVRASVVTAIAAAAGVSGRLAGAGRRTVERTRRLLRLEGVSEPQVPEGVQVDLEGISPWQTPSAEFYLIHTAIAVPTIDLAEWSLRIHGMVENEIVLDYQDLLSREFSEAWITLNCVSNPVGGGLVGNAWWSGVPIRTLLEAAGVRDGADAILQTSEDGWTCGTPLAAVTDPEREAMLAVAMNGQPLPIEHGFPVRMIVPGLYGYVSATKWLVDIEVTRFSDFQGFWTPRGWSEKGPVKTASRVDVPTSGSSVSAGSVRVGGVAWHQHSGITGVQISLDDGDWQDVDLAKELSLDTWLQWSATVEMSIGDHTLKVRARDGDGVWQTGDERDVAPDGATGWHTISVTAEA